MVREELDRNNKYLEFAQSQIGKDRSFYKHLYGFAAGFIAFMVAIAGFFQYTSVNQMRTEMRASLSAELERDKAEIASLRAQASATNTEAQATVARELANVRTEVQKRIDTEFQAENITARIHDAARSITEKQLETIIRSVTLSQVEKGIKQQQPFIQRTVEDQTREAVKALEPTISSSVEKATGDQVRKSVAPIQDQMKVYADYIRMGNLATLARSDDRHAFDYLVQVASGNKPESAIADLRGLADATVRAVRAEKESPIGLARGFNEKQTPDAMKKFMSSAIPEEREAALDNYPQDDKTVLPILVEIIRGDPSITVLYKAVMRFNGLTKQAFGFWRTKEILNWWDKNQESFR